MGDPVAQFARETAAIDEASPLHSGSVLHVYRARLVDVSRPVRVFTPAPDTSDAVASAFERAARRWCSLDDHPGVVTALATGDAPRPWLAVADDDSLTDARGALSFDEQTAVLGDVAEALRHAVREEAVPVVWPRHVRVRTAGDAAASVIARIEWPLGRACQIGAGQESVTPYTPPELLADTARTTERSVVYALGGVAFYALTGAPPVETNQVDDLEAAIRDGDVGRATTLDPTLPPAVDEVLGTALATNPVDRYDSVYECKLALVFDLTSAGTDGATTDSPAASTAANERVNRASAGGETGTGDGQPTRGGDGQTGDEREAKAGDAGREAADSGSGIGIPNVSRRAALGSLGVGTVGAVVGGGWLAARRLRTGAQRDGLPTFQYDHANTGYAPNEHGPRTDATVAWTVETGDVVVSSPAVVDGTVYIGSANEQLYALDTATGDVEWTADMSGPVVSSPTVTGDTVYVRSGNVNRDEGRTYALDASAGTERWTFGTGGHVAPVVADGSAYVAAVQGLVALDPADGTEQWAADVPTPTSIAPALVDDTIYYVGRTTDRGDEDPRTVVTALDTTDGTTRWTHPDQESRFPSVSSPAVVDGTVYVGTDARLLALDADDGSTVWSRATDSGVSASPAVADGTVYVHDGRNRLDALDAGTGEERWHVNGGANPTSSPAIAGDVLYMGIDEFVVAMNTDDGETRWSFGTGGDIISSPAVVDGALYVGSGDNSIYALTEAE